MPSEKPKYDADKGLTEGAIDVRDKLRSLATDWCRHSSNGLDVMASSCLDDMADLIKRVRP